MTLLQWEYPPELAQEFRGNEYEALLNRGMAYADAQERAKRAKSDAEASFSADISAAIELLHAQQVRSSFLGLLNLRAKQ